MVKHFTCELCGCGFYADPDLSVYSTCPCCYHVSMPDHPTIHESEGPEKLHFRDPDQYSDASDEWKMMLLSKTCLDAGGILPETGAAYLNSGIASSGDLICYIQQVRDAWAQGMGSEWKFSEQDIIMPRE